MKKLFAAIIDYLNPSTPVTRSTVTPPPPPLAPRDVIDEYTEDDPAFIKAFALELAACHTLTDLSDLYEKLDEKGAFAAKVLKCIESRTEDSFEGLLDVYEARQSISPLSQSLAKKCLALAVTATEFTQLRNAAHDVSSEDGELIFAAVQAKTWTAEDAHVFIDVGDTLDLDTFGRLIVLQQPNTFEGLVTSFYDYIFNCTVDDPVLDAFYSLIVAQATPREIHIITLFLERAKAGQQRRFEEACRKLKDPAAPAVTA